MTWASQVWRRRLSYLDMRNRQSDRNWLRYTGHIYMHIYIHANAWNSCLDSGFFLQITTSADVARRGLFRICGSPYYRSIYELRDKLNPLSICSLWRAFLRTHCIAPL